MQKEATKQIMLASQKELKSLSIEHQIKLYIPKRCCCGLGSIVAPLTSAYSTGVDADLKSPKGGIDINMPSASAGIDADLSGKGGIDLPSGG